jgi:nitrite reductase/ring-hydroxylating ferredoxin subunit
VPYVTVARVGDLACGKGRVVHAGGREIALFRLADGVAALENACCHRGGPLGDGEVDGGCVVCPWHGWRFEIATGRCVAPVTGGGVAPMRARIAGDEVQVEAPDAQPSR